MKVDRFVLRFDRLQPLMGFGLQNKLTGSEGRLWPVQWRHEELVFRTVVGSAKELVKLLAPGLNEVSGLFDTPLGHCSGCGDIV